jgi:chromosomal replication initiator protein
MPWDAQSYGRAREGLYLSTQNASTLWKAVLGDLQLRVTRPSYETWLKDTVGVSIATGEFVVGAPNAFVAEMLDQRMYSLICGALERVVEGEVDVKFEVISPEAGRKLVRTAPLNGNDSLPAPSTDGATQMNPKYTFENFIVGSSNELGHAAALAVSERPGVDYNPLFIYSGVGLGKTHLLHAIGHRVMAAGLSVIYATTEEFTNEFIKAIRGGQAEVFRDRYRSADILLLDDIQFLIGKEQTQEGFFHTFNSLHMAGKQIVISSDRPANSLTLLEDRISSRLAGGLAVDIQSPDVETRLSILSAKAEQLGQSFPSEVLQFLSERVHSNIRELEGCLNRLAAFADLASSAITLDLVKRAIADIIKPSSARRVSQDAVLDAVCVYFGTDRDTMMGRRRDKHTAMARQVTMYLLREEGNMQVTAIGRFLGGRDHSTVLHACAKISNQLNVDANLRRDVLNIHESL